MPTGQSIEQNQPTTPEIGEFQASARNLIEDFNFRYSNGVKTEDGPVTLDSLYSALDRLSSTATLDPAVLELVKSVNQSSQAELSRVDKQPPTELLGTPHYALLKLFGAAEKLGTAKQTDASENLGKSSNIPRKVGHQILVDGHVVQGLIGPGEHEITAPNGVLRTRETPRTHV